MTRYHMFWMICRKCGFHSEFPAWPSSDDHHILKTKTGLFYKVSWSLDGNVMSEFDEICRIKNDYLSSLQISDYVKSDILGLIYPKVCDSPHNKEEFIPIGRKQCFRCGSLDVDWGPTDPPISMDLDLPEVTYTRWNKLTAEAKKKFVAELIDSELENL